MKELIIVSLFLFVGFWIGDFMVCYKMLNPKVEWCEPVIAKVREFTK